MLGKLCRKMRLLGFDSELCPEGESGRFLLNADREGRIAVTRSKHFQNRPGPSPVILESKGTADQIAELFGSLAIPPEFEPFMRCLECNSPLVRDSAASAKKSVPPYVAESFDEFQRCPGCGRIYWKGTHYTAMAEEVDRIKKTIGKV